MRWKNLDGLLAYIKKNPGKLNYGTSGAPTAPYLTMAAILAMQGLKATPVHYKGSGPARNAALGGHVDFSAGGFGAMQALIRAGKLVAWPSRTTRGIQVPQDSDLERKGTRTGEHRALGRPLGAEGNAQGGSRQALRGPQEDRR